MNIFRLDCFHNSINYIYLQLFQYIIAAYEYAVFYHPFFLVVSETSNSSPYLTPTATRTAETKRDIGKSIPQHAPWSGTKHPPRTATGWTNDKGCRPRNHTRGEPRLQAANHNQQRQTAETPLL